MLQSSLYCDIIYLHVTSVHVSSFVPELIENQSIPYWGKGPSIFKFERGCKLTPVGISFILHKVFAILIVANI